MQVFSSLTTAIESIDVPLIPTANEENVKPKTVDQVFIIGGVSLYTEALAHPFLVSRILLTSVETDVPNCDVFLPTISATKFQMTYRSDLKAEYGLEYRFLEFERFSNDKKIGVVRPSSLLGDVNEKNFEECQYLNIIQVQDCGSTGTYF